MNSARKEFGLKTKRAAFARCCVEDVPRCEGLLAGEGWGPQVVRCNADLRNRPFHYDHANADFFSKDNSLLNCVVLCEPCHKEKTKTVDRPNIDKARRIYHARSKTKRRGPPMPGSKASGVKKRMDGSVIDRRTGRIIKTGWRS